MIWCISFHEIAQHVRFSDENRRIWIGDIEEGGEKGAETEKRREVEISVMVGDVRPLRSWKKLKGEGDPCHECGLDGGRVPHRGEQFWPAVQRGIELTKHSAVHQHHRRDIC